MSWVPVNIAAASIIEMSRSSEPIFHLVSPKPVAWSIIFGAFAKRLVVPLIPYDEWICRMSSAAESNTDKENVPALSLADFFRSSNFGESVKLSTIRGCAAAPALANMQQLIEKDALKYIDFWQKIGYLRN
jgi:hypothetical protein